MPFNKENKMFEDNRRSWWNPSLLDWISNCTHSVLAKYLLILLSRPLHSLPSIHTLHYVSIKGVKKRPQTQWWQKRPCLNATDAPHSDLPILSHVKSCLPLIFLLKTPWQLFLSQSLLSPPALTGPTDHTAQPWKWQLSRWPHFGRTLVGILFSQMW